MDAPLYPLQNAFCMHVCNPNIHAHNTHAVDVATYDMRACSMVCHKCCPDEHEGNPQISSFQGLQCHMHGKQHYQTRSNCQSLAHTLPTEC